MTAPETVVRYYNFDIVFAEIPGETTLAIKHRQLPEPLSGVSIVPTCRPTRGMCSTPRNCAPCWNGTAVR